ncbi:uncharacterized protein LOC142366533 isoform X1 [Odontesthes bonariensis]|uniref:uncharacterized protein LOC142366533 isoform X1 n=1 Tax=Odontesthes bonariensis TaxID=219752 RepID=UPI003F58F87E
MRSAALFLLTVCCSISQGWAEASASIHHDISPEFPILWDELRGLKELVLSLKVEEVGRRQALRNVESQLRDKEVEVEQQRQSLDRLQVAVEHQAEELRKTLLTELSSGLRRRVEELEKQSKARAAEMAQLQSRVNSSESSLDELTKKNSALAAELPFLQTRLRASESTVDQLRRKNTVLAARLCNTESLMEDLRGQISKFPASNSSFMMIPEVSALESRLNVQLENLQTNTEDQISEVRNKLNSSELHLDLMRRNAADQTAQLFSVKTQLEEFKTQSADQISEVRNKLNSSELHLDLMRRNAADQTAQLFSVKTQLEEFKTQSADQISEVRNKLNSSELHLDLMRRNTADQTAQLFSVKTQLEEFKTQSAGEIHVCISITLAPNISSVFVHTK